LEKKKILSLPGIEQRYLVW